MGPSRFLLKAEHNGGRMNGFYFNIQYGQDLQDYLEILNSRFTDETVKKPNSSC